MVDTRMKFIGPRFFSFHIRFWIFTIFFSGRHLIRFDDFRVRHNDIETARVVIFFGGDERVRWVVQKLIKKKKKVSNNNYYETQSLENERSERHKRL